ncbi:hypothetical protein ACU5AX_11770 [Sphingomonas sp. XXL09]|uniref:hypothetical protein n=1 Tax=Sphingomonas sp. XXL09 TaxID=3457787 RepID=UPI00406BD609
MADDLHAAAIGPAWRARPAVVLAAILGFALLLRLVAMATPSIIHPDEIFQYLEPAHRWLFGYGIVPWEAHYGIRNWLLPILITGPMALGHALAPATNLYIVLPKLFAVLVSLTLPATAWVLGRRLSPAHGALAALVTASWAEFVIFAPHTLSEQFALAAMLPTAAVLLAAPAQNRRALAAAGALLMLAGLFRFQYAPALATLALATIGRRPDRWPPLIAGALAMAVLGALVDLATGLSPFGWFVENIRQNLLQNRASYYGTLGPLGYVTWFEHMWRWWLIPIAPLVWIGGKRYPALLATAIVHLVFHSLIAHKEYRFVELSAVLFILLAAIGSVDVADRLARRRPNWPPRLILGTVAALWLVASASTLSGRELHGMRVEGSDTLALTSRLRADPDLCGVALFANDLVEWGGYVELHRPVPVTSYLPGDPMLHGRTPSQALAADAGRINRIIGNPDGIGIPAGFTRTACAAPAGGQKPTMCLYARPGQCRGGNATPFALQSVFNRTDQLIRDAARADALRASRLSKGAPAR